jgi:hypothetical protein
LWSTAKKPTRWPCGGIATTATLTHSGGINGAATLHPSETIAIEGRYGVVHAVTSRLV